MPTDTAKPSCVGGSTGDHDVSVDHHVFVRHPAFYFAYYAETWNAPEGFIFVWAGGGFGRADKIARREARKTNALAASRQICRSGRLLAVYAGPTGEWST